MHYDIARFLERTKQLLGPFQVANNILENTPVCHDHRREIAKVTVRDLATSSCAVPTKSGILLHPCLNTSTNLLGNMGPPLFFMLLAERFLDKPANHVLERVNRL